MKKQWNILARDNRGSGIIVVLISMVCVGLMGASLMFMSYTAIRLKATERQASKDFYSAETAMDEIRAGVQSAVSEAIATSYKYALETYSSGTDIEERFEKRFLLDLQNTGLLESSGNNYKVETLKKYISNLADEVDSPGVRVKSTGASVTKEIDIATNTTKALVLNGIEVEYTAPNGYTTKISTDLSIDMPKFVYTTTATSFAGLPQHALIAKTALNHTSGNKAKIAITGSAYAGSMKLTVADSQLAIKNGTLVCAGNVDVSGAGPDNIEDGEKYGRLVTDDTVKFWAERIEVKGGSSVNLNGETRVLDDLELAGAKAEATLSGIYYGFGDGLVNPAKDYIVDENDNRITVEPSKRSSAILVNGLNSKLDLSNLRQLILAGRAYISDSLYSVPLSGSENAVPTVESISVRSNQQMYLVDPRYLEVYKAKSGTYVSVTENPIAIPDNDTSYGDINELIKPENNRIRLKASDEDGNAITIRGGRLTYRKYTFNNLDLIYCYMEFEDPSAENEYLETYFKEHADNMGRYLVDGEVLSDLNPTSGTIYSLGYTIQNDQNKEGAYAVSRPSGKIDSTGMRSTYNQLKTTLVDANTDPGVDNPYNYIVNETKLNQLRSDEERKFECTWTDDGATKKAQGLVTRGSYTIDGDTDPLTRLIIAAGDVTVTKNYNGLIICGGTITIEGTVDMSAEPKDVMHVFDAVDSTGTALREYLREGITGSDGASSNDGWKLSSLVTYKNWTKS